LLQKNSEKTPRPNRQGKKTHLYSEESVREAVEAVRKKELSQCEAAKRFGVPKTTIRRKAKGIYYKDGTEKPMLCKPGPDPVLSSEAVAVVEAYLLDCSDRGFPIRAKDFKKDFPSILKAANIPNPFTNGIPSESYFHTKLLPKCSKLSIKGVQPQTKGKAAVEMRLILTWGRDTRLYLVKQHLDSFYDSNPECIYGMDETAHYVNDTKGLFISRKGISAQIVLQGSEKENVTVAVTHSASGEMVPPFVVLKGKATPKRFNDQGLEVTFSSKGWMDQTTMLKYLRFFHRYNLSLGRLEHPPNPEKKVFLFLDGHSSHVTYSVSKYCEERNIVLICLPPNCTHILQPADVLIMASLKNLWRNALSKHHLYNPSSKIGTQPLLSLLKTTYEEAAKDHENLQKSFKITGLWPWDPSQINPSKLISTRQKSVPSVVSVEIDAEQTLRDNLLALQKFEEALEPESLVDLQSGKKVPFLYNIWIKLRKAAELPDCDNGMH